MCLVPRCRILSLTEDKPCQVAIHDLEVLPFRAAVLEDDVVEEESHTLSGYGVLHNDILYPRGAMRFVISRPCKAKGRDATRVRIVQSPSFGRHAPGLDLYMSQASRNPLHEEVAQPRSSVRSARICLPSAIRSADATKSFASQVALL